MEIGNNGRLSIILADDDSDDRMFFKDAVAEIGGHIDLKTVKDGDELMKLLKDSAILPAIIFLDLNMPRKNGFDCLTEIRSDERLKNIFVVIYSTTGSQYEIELTFNKNANLFIHKFYSFSELKKALTMIFSMDINSYSLLHPERNKFVLTVK